MEKKEKQSVQDRAIQVFCDTIIKRMEEISIDYKQSWITPNCVGIPQNISGREYGGINRFIMLLEQQEKGYITPVYLTWGQAQDEGVNIKKGEKSFPVCFWNFSIKDKDGKKIKYEDYKTLSKEEQKLCELRPYMKVYNVFNLDQTNFSEIKKEKWEKIKEKVTSAKPEYNENLSCCPKVDEMIEKDNWVCHIKHIEGNRAFYSPSSDTITIPLKEQFISGEEYYSTLFHEMTHSTGIESRLNRKMGNSFGSPEYAREELVAELSAALSCNQIGISNGINDNNVAYLQSWIKGVKEEPNYLIKILGDVSKAYNLINERVFGENMIIQNDEIVNVEPDITNNEKIILKETSDNLEEKKLYMAHLGNGISLWEEGDLEYTGLIHENRTVSILKGKEFSKDNKERINEFARNCNMLVGDKDNVSIVLDPINRPSKYHYNESLDEKYELSVENINGKEYVVCGKQVFKGEPSDYKDIKNTEKQFFPQNCIVRLTNRNINEISSLFRHLNVECSILREINNKESISSVYFLIKDNSIKDWEPNIHEKEYNEPIYDLSNLSKEIENIDRRKFILLSDIENGRWNNRLGNRQFYTQQKNKNNVNRACDNMIEKSISNNINKIEETVGEIYRLSNDGKIENTFKFKNSKEYINAIKEEMNSNINNFKFKTTVKDATEKERIEDLIKTFFNKDKNIDNEKVNINIFRLKDGNYGINKTIDGERTKTFKLKREELDFLFKDFNSIDQDEKEYRKTVIANKYFNDKEIKNFPQVDNNTIKRICDVSVFKMTDGKNYCIRCKIDGIQQMGKRLDKEDVSLYFNLLKNGDDINNVRTNLAAKIYDDKLNSQDIETKNSIKR